MLDRDEAALSNGRERSRASEFTMGRRSIPDVVQSGAALLLAACMLSAMPVAAADDDFYKGKVLTIVSGEPPGGAADAYARLLGPALGRHLPGNPTVIVQSKPGASSMVAANYVYKIAPKDGTTLLMVLSQAIFASVFGSDGAVFNPTELTWIGNLDQATGTCSVLKGAGVASFEDLLKSTTLFGASAPSGVASQYPRSLNALFGTRVHVIHGYGGTSALFLAMQRGEIQGSCAFQLSALKSAFRTSYEAGDLVPIVQFARKSPELKGVPHVLDFARTEQDRQVFNLVYNRDILGRSVAAPPGLPPARVALLRAGFDAAVKDPELIAAADRAGLPLIPMSGLEAEAFVHDMMSAAPQVVARARAALEFGQQENQQLKSVAGTIVETGASRIEVKDADGVSHRLQVSETESTIMLDGKQAAPAALHAGMACFLRYTDADMAQIIACK
jgi:tripartite-type tricarboxylate transporter receptor subunit TctC